MGIQTNKRTYQQTGFGKRNIMGIYNSLSEDTYFTLQLFDNMPDSQPPALEISGSKELNKEALEARLSALARYDLYDHMDMNCNAGFGNSVTLRLYGKR